MKVLYISYDGILEPLGQSQVFSYLEKLSARHGIFLLSYEKPEDWRNHKRREALSVKMNAAGIKWLPLRYHKRISGLATAFDIFKGIMVGIWITLRYRIQIVHARSYVPSVIALVLKKMFDTAFLFDMRGFWADERVDGGLWPENGKMFRLAKWFEKRFLLSADCVVSLTSAAVDEMRTFPYLQKNMPRFEVITTCTDLDLFNQENTISDGDRPHRPFTLGYVGAAGGWYLFDETVRCFKALQEQVPDARLQILNWGEHAYIHDRLLKAGVAAESVHIDIVDHAGVARAMQEMDAGIFIIKPAYSKLASAPTKLGEFLGCGVPCIGNTGIGDMADILEGERVGVVLDRFEEASRRTAIEKLLLLTQNADIKSRCREVALRHFSLTDGVQKYDRIYRELAD